MRVSTRTTSPCWTNNGTRTTAPVSRVAGLPPPPDVSPRTPGSVSVICNSTKLGGVTDNGKPLNKVIINYFDSNAENLAQKINRCMAMEYNNPDKKAIIYIVSSNEIIELKWLTKALEFFDKNKIKYV